MGHILNKIIVIKVSNFVASQHCHVTEMWFLKLWISSSEHWEILHLNFKATVEKMML